MPYSATRSGRCRVPSTVSSSPGQPGADGSYPSCRNLSIHGPHESACSHRPWMKTTGVPAEAMAELLSPLKGPSIGGIARKVPGGTTPARSHGDDDFSSSVSLFQIAHGLGDLAERVRLADDRRDLARLDELLEQDQLLPVLLRDERAQFLAHERRQHARPELAIDASEPPSAPF